MGEKKNDAGEKKKKNDGDGGDKKKEDSPMTVVLKIDMHCEGCASKYRKTVLGFEGVQKAVVETDANKLTVIGKVDPSEVREKLAEKTGKKVDLVSPQPKKKEKDEKKDDNKKKADGNDNKNKADDKKPKEKEPPVTTAVIKLRLHCQGCIQKIHRIITKTKGYNDMSIDKQKDLITVVGSMDMKALAESLQEKLKRPVEIVPPKKEKEGGGEKEGGKGGGKKKGGGGDGGQKVVEESRMEYAGQPIPAFGYGLGYPPGYGYGYGYPPGYVGENMHAPHMHAPHMHAPPMHAPPMHANPMHAPQLFSDENPNACSVM
ncbi:hypothetical protein UlMin_028938 [Ulmus minor]